MAGIRLASKPLGMTMVNPSRADKFRRTRLLRGEIRTR